ncbi:MAG: hypothetical protein ACOY7L_16915 [Pseudomonadota bacterium]
MAMGEAKNKSRKRDEILEGENRCIYCDNSPDSVEHMPPRSIFDNGGRPSGLEFASCSTCNYSSRASDAAASFLARVSPEHKASPEVIRRASKILSTLSYIAPGFIREIFDPNKSEEVWAKGRSNIYGKMQKITLDGPITTSLMQAFGAKLGMAPFREHTGNPIPMEAKVFVQHYFNSGLYRGEVENILSILPAFGQLTQGKKTSGRTFNYRYNTDKREILGAFCAFSDNLFFRIFAVCNPIYDDVLFESHDHKPIQPGTLPILSESWRHAFENKNF